MISTAHNTKPFNLDSFRSSLRPHRAVNCILATICIISVCAIAVVSAIVVREYSLSEDYQAALCRLQNLSYTDLDAQCVFCSGTVDKTRDRKIDACHVVHFPCLRATVAFNVLGHTHRGQLYSDTIQATGNSRQVGPTQALYNTHTLTYIHSCAHACIHFYLRTYIRACIYRPPFTVAGSFHLDRSTSSCLQLCYRDLLLTGNLPLLVYLWLLMFARLQNALLNLVRRLLSNYSCTYAVQCT